MRSSSLIASLFLAPLFMAAPALGEEPDCVEREILYAADVGGAPTFLYVNVCAEGDYGAYVLGEFQSVARRCQDVGAIRVLGQPVPGTGVQQCSPAIARPYGVETAAPRGQACAATLGTGSCTPAESIVVYVEIDGAWRETNGLPGLQRSATDDGQGGEIPADTRDVVAPSLTLEPVATPVPIPIFGHNNVVYILPVIHASADAEVGVQVWEETNHIPGLQTEIVYGPDSRIIQPADTRLY